MQYHPDHPNERHPEAGRASALVTTSIKGYGELVGNRRLPQTTGEDVTTRHQLDALACSSATRSFQGDKEAAGLPPSDKGLVEAPSRTISTIG